MRVQIVRSIQARWWPMENAQDAQPTQPAETAAPKDRRAEDSQSSPDQASSTPSTPMSPATLAPASRLGAKETEMRVGRYLTGPGRESRPHREIDPGRSNSMLCCRGRVEKTNRAGRSSSLG